MEMYHFIAEKDLLAVNELHTCTIAVMQLGQGAYIHGTLTAVAPTPQTIHVQMEQQVGMHSGVGGSSAYTTPKDMWVVQLAITWRVQ